MMPFDPYHSADELRVSPEVRTALIRLSAELIEEVCTGFDMHDWDFCIRGQLLSRHGVEAWHVPALAGLFLSDPLWFERGPSYDSTSQREAGVAIQRWLLRQPLPAA